MPQFDARSSKPNASYRRDGKPCPGATVLLEIDYRCWRLTPEEARKLGDLLRAAATTGEELAKECARDAEGDRVG